MKIISWNINGWRAMQKKPYLTELIKKHDPDILCFQETKINKNVKMEIEGYECESHIGEKPGYSGTAIFYKTNMNKPLNIYRNDEEGRLICLEFDTFSVVSVYVPNSGAKLARLQYRVEEWDNTFIDELNALKKDKKPLIVVGDMNVARTEHDLKNPKSNERSAGYTIEERNSFENILDKANLNDVWRDIHPYDPKDPSSVQYSYWSYYTKARERNAGWRIDYALLSGKVKVKRCEILTEVFGSDHAPVLLEF
jgi:exodeoxyribonuclease-3